MNAVSSMNFGAAHPDEVLTDPRPMSLQHVRSLLNALGRHFDDVGIYDRLEVNGEEIDGRELVQQLREAESAVSLVERRVA